MKALSIAMLFGAATLAGGCVSGDTGGDKDDTAETAVDTDTDTDTDTDMGGPPMWDTTGWTNGWSDAVTLGCTGDGQPGTVAFTLRTDNWGYSPVHLYFAGTRFTAFPYDEEHTLEETDTSPNPGGYSVFERSLTAGADFPNTPDTNTVFRCDAFEDGGENFDVTVAAAVSDEDGNIVDCIVFGHSPSTLIDQTLAGLTYPSWLTDACRDVN